MKIAIVLDEGLEAGLAANAAAALALSLSGRIGDVNGPDVSDGGGSVHPGILRLPIPVLRADGPGLSLLRERASGVAGLGVLDFTDLAQASRSYADYEAALSRASSTEFAYRGLCLYGDDRAVARLTGSLPLFR